VWPWHDDVKEKLQRIPPDGTGENYHYRENTPFHMALPDWPIFNWSLNDMKDRVGAKTLIQFQLGRNANPDYEIQSYALRAHDSFGTFLDLAVNGVANDAYIIAQNQEYNRSAMQPLYDGITPLPAGLLSDSSIGFFWIGGATITPLHHDLTNNLICQILGIKHIRMVSPDQFDKIDYREGVHSNIGWLTDEIASERGITVRDYILTPRDTLFVPVGWWHCVRTEEPSVTVVYTSFIWDNCFNSSSI
jgi:hypothetical protein